MQRLPKVVEPFGPRHPRKLKTLLSGSQTRALSEAREKRLKTSENLASIAWRRVLEGLHDRIRRLNDVPWELFKPQRFVLLIAFPIGNPCRFLLGVESFVERLSG